MTIVIHPLGNSLAAAVESLPPVTVSAFNDSLSESITAPQQLTEDDLNVAHERSMADVLQGVPGLSFTQGGGFGQPSLVLMRGAGGQGLITVDDIPLLPSLPGLQNLDTLPVEALESAELQRGPGAAYRPFQALGGAIRLTTLERQNSGGKLAVEGGSFGILRETLQGGLTGRLGRMTVTANRGDAFDGNHLAAAAANPEREPFRYTQGIMRFSSELDSRLSWQGSMLYRHSWLGTDTVGADPQFRAAFLDDEQSSGEAETWLAQTSWDAGITPTWFSHLQLGFTQLANTVSAGSLQSSLEHRMYLATLRNRQVLFDDDRRNIRWQLNWGGQGRHEQAHSQPAGFAEERTLAAGFLNSAVQYGAVSGEAGVRVEHYEHYGDQALFKTAAAWQITPTLTLRASGGTGYRIPSYTELLSLFFGNVHLKPERSATGDLGLAWAPTDAARIQLDGFYNRYDDLIIQVYDPFRGPVSSNVADASVAGMELQARYAWTDALTTGVSYSVSESLDLQSQRLLPLRSPHIARVWGQRKLSGIPVTVWAEAVVRSGAWNDAANSLAVDEAVKVNAAVRYAVAQSLEIYLRGENLGDDRSSQFYSADTPGIAVYGGLQADF